MDLLIPGLCGQSVFLKVPHFHRPEETLHASSLFAEPGGKGYNQAVAAARMGAKTAFAGAVGHDADGECCAARLVKEGIEPHMFEKEEQTAYAAILTDDAGENRVTVFAGARLEAADMRAMEDSFAQAKMLLITPEIPEAAFAEAIALAKKHGVKMVINPAPFMDWVRPYLRDAWCVTPNRSEAASMLDLQPEDDLLTALAESSFPRVLVTLGSQGAVCMEDGKLTQIPACPVKAIDTTGAGDCFNGALCARLLAGDTLAEAAKVAVKAASMSVQHAHVLDGMPYQHEVK